ncbi:MAG: hypothetical protein N4A49_16160 [Marinifilaceae bacterium]|jgi:predicted amidohydrolase|nr:hypothetical protein [Marinifilaceae bacterium]
MSDKLLNIALVQFDIISNNVDANLEKLDSILSSIENDTDLVVLPEMFTSGFLMDKKSEISSRFNDSIDWVKKWSIEKQLCIVGSVVFKDDKQNYKNKIIAFDNGVSISDYEKRHLFMKEKDHFCSGDSNSCIDIKGWKINLSICYDLRFPVWLRNDGTHHALICLANWPKSRRSIWDCLLRARAIENQVYVLAVNRLGEDSDGLKYDGGTQLVDFKGEQIALAEDNMEDVVYYQLDKQKMDDFKSKFPFYLDSDSFNINI